ncbi:MAG: hypothetical protein ACI94Y_002239 [Maribacter sp.]|jgi:hypothetical protein
MRIKLTWCIFAILMLFQSEIEAQVGINILYPDTSAILHLESVDRGLLFPRMNTTQRDAIVQPKAGLMVYNNQDSLMQYFNGVCWLNTFMKRCDDCFFDIQASSVADTIDRVVEDSVSFTIDITQNNGNPQNIALVIASQLPPGVTYSISPNPQFSTGTVTVTFYATPFAPAGTYPIVLQVLCGDQTTNFIYSLTLTPCYEVFASNSTNSYSVSSDLYATYPSLNNSIPVCVVSYVNTGVTLTSNSFNTAAYGTGDLHPNSIVALVNEGNIIGKGGDGGIAFDPVNGWDGAGEDGGPAVNLSVNTTVINNFNIYGGGGGGNSMAFALTFDLNQFGSPIPLPVIGIMIGAGGGGGAGDGAAGNIPVIIGLTYYQGGTAATGGQFGVPGVGGVLNTPIDLSQGPAVIILNPYAQGGDGGDYGYPGTQGIFGLTLNISVTINIPFVGPITIPVVQGLNIPLPIPTPAAGEGGFAIQRNGNACNIPDNLYNNSNLKGKVGN